MLPSISVIPVTRLLAGIASLIILVAALAFPARHVLLPLWPPPIEEVIVFDSGGRAVHRILASAGFALAEDIGGRVIARTRPLNATVLETPDQRKFGYLVGIRDPQAGEVIIKPELLDFEWLESDALFPGRLLLFEESGGEVAEIMNSEVKRVYRPNRMGFRQRLALAGLLLAERWQSSPEDA